MNEKNVQLLGMNKGVQARVWERKNDDSGILLVGYPVNTHGLALADGKQMQKTISAGANVDTAALLFANQIVMTYHTEQLPHDKELVLTDTPFMTAFLQLEDTHVLCNPAWSEDYRKSALSYFKNRIIPKLDERAPHLTEIDFASITQELIELTKSNGNSHGTDDYATKTVMGHLKRSNFLLYKLRKYTASPLPEGTFEIVPVSLVQREQPKYIPLEVRLRIAATLSRLTASSPLAMGVALMLFCGLRTAESCAVTIGDIGVNNDYVVVPVKGQIKNSTLTHELKTPSAYRNAIGDEAMVELIHGRIAALREQGFDEATIRTMPLNGTLQEDDSPKWADPNDLSAYGKALLLACGYKEALLDNLKILMDIEPDYDADGDILKDVSAYIMRRDFISRCCNYCGMACVDVDYLVGHKRETEGFVDYGNAIVQQYLGQQLNQYRFNYKKLPDKGSMPLDGRQQYRFEPVDYDRVVEFSLCSNEPNDKIHVTFGGEVEQVTVMTSHMDTSVMRQNRPILGEEYPKELYEKMMSQVEKMDLSFFETV